MVVLTEKQIKSINKKCPYNQGIFMEPFGIPDYIKELVIYTKWASGGRPGSCWDNENTINEDYTHERPYDAYDVLDLIFQELGIDNVFSKNSYEITGLFDSNTDTEYGYYGDYTEDTIEWIRLSHFLEIVNKSLRLKKLDAI